MQSTDLVRMGATFLCACGVIALWGCDQSGGSSATAVSGGASTTEGGATRTGDGGEGGGDAAVVVDDAAAELDALERLRLAIANGPDPDQFDTFDERFENARAWVEANRETTGNRAWFEAYVLAVFTDVLDNHEDMTVARLLGLMEIQQDMVRAMDADGDGTITADEATSFMRDMQVMQDPASHPYLTKYFDADGDGVVTEAEEQAISQKMENIGVALMTPMLERVELDLFDGDADGFVSDAERDEAIKAGRERLGGINFDFDQDGTMSPQELQSQRMMLLGERGGEYMMAMVMMEEPSEEDVAALQENAVVFETPVIEEAAFDEDLDGTLSEAERAAYDAEVAAAQQLSEEEMRRRVEASQSVHFQILLNQTKRRSDQDGDGRLSDEEWRRDRTNARDKRDTRIFQLNYDVDRSGRVDEAELDNFLRWHAAGSKRADANLDGQVNAGDLQRFMNDYQRQGTP